jgi:hypothetical protein
MMLSMPRRAREAFELYLDQESRRSLRRLAKDCAAKGVKTSEATLKRWSTRFAWQRLVIQRDREAEKESLARSADYRVRTLTDRLLLIDYTKERYAWLIDPENANLTPAQRKRVSHVTLSDFLRILKLEMETLKLLSELQRVRTPAPEDVRRFFPDEAIRAGVSAALRIRYQLSHLRAENRPLQRR